MISGLVDALAAGGLSVTTDPALLAGHCVDWTGRWRGPALGAVRPTTTEQVAAVLAAARGAGVAIQVQGGNTGLVGGSVPDRPALLLLTSGLDRLDPVDPVERTVRVGAGVTSARVAGHARAAGLRFGVDLAARDSATIGGMAATNAGGMGVLAHGMMREQVRGLVAVLADGRVLSTVGRPRKDNCGYDLGQLLVGSEGTLGVITEVELQLHEAPAESSVGVLAAGSLAQAVGWARRVQAAGWPLLAAEVVDAAGVGRASAALGRPDPLPAGAQWLLLLEVADGATGQGLTTVGQHVVALGTQPAERARLWALRETQTEVYAQLPSSPEKLDISLRLDALDAGVAAIRTTVAQSEAARADGPVGAGRVGFFGHALDGNLHVQLVDVAAGTAHLVLAQVAALGGSISAEHGIGRMKAGQLHRSRSAEEIAWMRQIRAGVDPSGLLNPGVLFDEAGEAGEADDEG
ncbi:MAG: FAD-binding oxidoreductase [Candidatus Nanopelagicales bacterium]